MKFRDQKTGELLEVRQAYNLFCEKQGGHYPYCRFCPISSHKTGSGLYCLDYLNMHTAKAALLMGYEVIEDSSTEIDETPTDSTTIVDDTPTKEENMEKNKPRLADVLGVEVGEKIKIAIPGKTETGWFQMDKNGCLKDVDNLCDLSGVYLAYAINHPETIIRTPRLTEYELAICKAIGALWLSLDSNEDFVKAWMDKPGIEGAGDGSWIRFNNGGNLYSFIAKIRKDLFPSVHPGDLIEVP